MSTRNALTTEATIPDLSSREGFDECLVEAVPRAVLHFLEYALFRMENFSRTNVKRFEFSASLLNFDSFFSFTATKSRQWSPARETSVFFADAASIALGDVELNRYSIQLVSWLHWKALKHATQPPTAI